MSSNHPEFRHPEECGEGTPSFNELSREVTHSFCSHPLSRKKSHAAAAAKSLQSCPTLSDSMGCSLPGSSIQGICQARVLEWGAIAFSKVTCYIFASPPSLGRGQAGEEKFPTGPLVPLTILHLDKGSQIAAGQLCLPCAAWHSCISLSQKLSSSGALAESSDDRSIEES